MAQMLASLEQVSIFWHKKSHACTETKLQLTHQFNDQIKQNIFHNSGAKKIELCGGIVVHVLPPFYPISHPPSPPPPKIF